MINLKQRDHIIKEKDNMIEIWKNERFIGAIYPIDKGIKILSKFNITCVNILNEVQVIINDI